MTTDAIAARNRANARQSTGPKTTQGKAISAGNARRHGATARPDPDSVGAWLAIILDRPHVAVGDLMPEDDGGYRALVLAQAEARLVAAEQALITFEAGKEEPDEAVKDLRDMAKFIIDALQENGGTAREVKSGFALLKRLIPTVANETGPGGKRHRLLRRYVREARAHRRRAFEAWAASGRQGALPA